MKITDHKSFVISITVVITITVKYSDKIVGTNKNKQALCARVTGGMDLITASGNLDGRAINVTNVLKIYSNQLVIEKRISAKDSNTWYNFDLLNLRRKRDKQQYQYFKTKPIRLVQLYG